MKTSNITKSALALALGLCASGAWALTTTNAFENFTCAADTPVTNLTSTGLSWTAGADAADYTYAKASTGKLVVDTGDSSVTGALSNATAFNNNIANSASFEAKVTFTPATETPSVGGSDLKFALYTKAGTGTTNLYVYANGGETNTEIAVAANTEKTVKVDFLSDSTFQVSVDGSAAAGPYNFANSGTISKVEFQGNGEVDDLAFTYDATPYTMTWVADSASYVVDGVTNSLAGETSPFTYYGEPGQTVKIIGKQGYMIGETVVVAGSSAALVLDAYSTDLADYFANGEGTAANPYQIATANDLIALKDAVANVEAARSKSYIQTANIDMASAGAFDGIGTYKKVPTQGTPFLGTYDGQGYTIANVTRAGGDTQGIFNQVGPSGVIENLVVSNMTAASGITGFGFAIVGNAGGGATLRNLTAAGTFASAENPGGHNMAGIVVRVCGGASDGVATTIDSCTNNATIYGAYTKLGGICAIAQYQTGFSAGKVVFSNCANNGTLVSTRNGTGITGIAGMVGYVQANVDVENCYGNGVVNHAADDNIDRDGALVGWAYSETLTDNGGNVAPADKVMLGYQNPASFVSDGKTLYCTVNGFKYATVTGDVATTISGSPVAGGSYLLEGNAAPAITLADGESVTFDKSLGYTLTETAITAATGCTVTSSGDTTRRFDSAYVTVTVTVTGDTSHLNAAWTVNSGEPSAVAPGTLTYGDTYAVTFTAASGYAIKAGETASFSGTAGSENISIAAPLVEELPSYEEHNGVTVSGGTHELTGPEASYLNTLVSENDAATVEEKLAALTEKEFTDAVLLNQDITEDDAGSYEFNVTKIKKSGTDVTVTVKLTRDGTLRGGINGTLVLQTCATPTGTYADAQTLVIDGTAFATDAAEATANFTFTGVTGDSNKFFKAVIR